MAKLEVLIMYICILYQVFEYFTKVASAEIFLTPYLTTTTKITKKTALIVQYLPFTFARNRVCIILLLLC